MRSDLQSILDRVQVFMNEHLTPLEKEYHNKAWSDVLPHLEAIRLKAKAAGFWTPQIPLEYGGMGLSVSEFGEVCAVLGKVHMGSFR